MTPVLSLTVLLLETAVLVLSLLLAFRRRGLGTAAAMTHAVALYLMGLSCVFQVAFLARAPAMALVVEAVAVVAAAAAIARSRAEIVDAAGRLRAVARRRPLTGAVLFASGSYLAAQTLLLPPSTFDTMTHNLTRVLLFEQERTFFLESVVKVHSAVFPVGSDILAHAVLRWGNDYGVAWFSFLAWVGCVFGAYAASRRYAGEDASLTAATVVGSLPQVVYQATSAKEDLLAALAALFCVLVAQEVRERPRPRHALLLAWGLSFGFSCKAYFAAFAAPFVLLLGAVLWHRRSFAGFVLGARRGALVVGLLPAAVLSQAWLLVHNRLRWGGVLGPPWFTERHHNPDGLAGAAGNLIRYAFQTVDLLPPTQELVERLTGTQATSLLRLAYDAVYPERLGHVADFAVRWRTNLDLAWFGPLGFLVVLPSILRALFRGAPEVRALGAVLLSFAFGLAWQVRWMPWNGRFFTLFFVVAAPCVAAWLAVRHGAIGRAAHGLALVVLVFACASNFEKPTTIWTATDWGRDRHFYARGYVGDQGIEMVRRFVPAGAAVGLLTAREAWTFPYLSRRPDVRFVPLNRCNATGQTPGGRLEYLLCLGLPCTLEARLFSARTIWAAGAAPGEPDGALLALEGDVRPGPQCVASATYREPWPPAPPP